MSEKTFPVPLRSTVEGMQWLYNTATDNFIRELRDANAELAALRAEVARLTRERDEAREALADAGTLMDRTIAMSYCTSAEMPEKDHTHALPSAMLGVIRERDEARERAAGLSRELLAAMHRLQDLVAAEARFAEAEDVLREIADECDCGFPRCQSTIARAALGEEGE